MSFYNSVITVIPTFFTEENEVDYTAISKHIEKQCDSGIKTIVILGTTSETPTLNLEEKINIASLVWESFHEKINIICGVGGFNTPDVFKEACALESFCNAIMISAPYYNKPSQEGIYQHMSHIISNLDKEFVLYNVPSRCGVNMEPETIARIFNDFKNVKAIKEASGSIEQVIRIKSLCDIVVMSGDDALTLPFMSVGATGVISVVSNAIPKQMLMLVNAFSSGNFSVAKESFYNCYPLMKLCFIESNPVPIKYILHKFNNSNEHNYELVRLPMVKLSNQSKQKINDYLDTTYESVFESIVSNYINSSNI
jgi:4-hydroxy-tetrahydrodipicolinate synthase